ncbi:RNA polymerase sigma factor [Nocardia brasiliensis]
MERPTGPEPGPGWCACRIRASTPAPGSVDAFEQLYRRHSALLWRYVHATFGEAIDPDDLVHEVMLVAWERWDTLRDLDESAQRAWLFTTGQRRIIDRWRRRDSRSIISMGPDTFRNLYAQDTSPDGLDVVVAQDLTRRALQGLSNRQREVLSRSIAGYSTLEIAAALQTTVEAVRQQLSRARQIARNQVAAVQAEIDEDLAPSPSRGQITLTGEVAEQFWTALSTRLSKTEYEVAFMAWSSELADAEIATELGMTRSTVASIKAKSRRKITAMLNAPDVKPRRGVGGARSEQER